MMFTLDQIIEVARKKGHTEEEIQRIIAMVGNLKSHGLVKTSGRGSNVGLTVAGRRKVAELKATGKIQ